VPAGGDGEEQVGGDLGPLPGGHHGLSREQVAESQRERLLAAIAELIAEQGYPAVTITEIVKRASVATRVFYENFKTKDAAFVAAFDAIADHLRDQIAVAVADRAEWDQRVIAALRTTAAFFDAEPALARFCLVAPFTASAEVAAHCRETVAPAMLYLAQGRSLHPGEELPASTEDSLLGGVISQLSRRILTEAGPLVDLLPDLTEFVLSPYVGTDEARRLAAATAA
jgi:AcrR family transcriptional regulator